MSLCKSCRVGDQKLVHELILQGHHDWNHGLYGACEGGAMAPVGATAPHLSLAELMISKGANNWNYGLQDACFGGAMAPGGATAPHLSLAELMISKGANNWNYGLQDACSGGAMAPGGATAPQLILAKLMISKGADDWNNGLYAACFRGDLSLAELMISKGANDWNRGLYAACSGYATRWIGGTAPHLSLVILMIAKGANNFACLKWYKISLLALCELGLDIQKLLLIDPEFFKLVLKFRSSIVLSGIPRDDTTMCGIWAFVSDAILDTCSEGKSYNVQALYDLFDKSSLDIILQFLIPETNSSDVKNDSITQDLIHLQLFNKIKHRGPDYSVFKTFGSTTGSTRGSESPTPSPTSSPTSSPTYSSGIAVGFHLLAMSGPVCSNMQPFIHTIPGEIRSTIRQLITLVNGEIYNHKELATEFKLTPDMFNTTSDCEVLPLLYLQLGSRRPQLSGLEILKLISNKLNSEHAFILMDLEYQDNILQRYKIFTGTDRFSTRPLFMANCVEGGYYWASELVGLPINRVSSPWTYTRHDSATIGVLEANTIYATGQAPRMVFHKYFDLSSIQEIPICNQQQLDARKRLTAETFRRAVEKRLLQTVRPTVVMNSGGLDSASVCGFASMYQRRRGGASGPGFAPGCSTFGPGFSPIDSTRIITVCGGTLGSQDLEYARQVADFIDSIHHEILFNYQELLDVHKNLDLILGCPDSTTKRASSAQLLTLQKFSKKCPQFKNILTGDGADELEGGYDENLATDGSGENIRPRMTPEQFHNNCIQRLNAIHYFDGLRVDRTTSAFGLEARYPFLDIDFVTNYLEVPAVLRMAAGGLTKTWFRESIQLAYPNLLPKQVLTRPKIAFSDGISNRAAIEQKLGGFPAVPTQFWYQVLNEYIANYFAKQNMNIDQLLADYNLKSAEQLYNVLQFERHFGPLDQFRQACLPYFWTFNAELTGIDTHEPSAMALEVSRRSD